MARAITVESVCPLRLQRAPPSVPKLFGLQPITINQVHQLTHLLYDLKFKHLQLGVMAVLHSCDVHAMHLSFYDKMMMMARWWWWRGWSVMRHYPDGTITRGAHALCMYDSTRDCQTHYRDENKTQAILGQGTTRSLGSYYCVCNTRGVSYRWE